METRVRMCSNSSMLLFDKCMLMKRQVLISLLHHGGNLGYKIYIPSRQCCCRVQSLEGDKYV